MQEYTRAACRPLSETDLCRARTEKLGELDDRSLGCIAFSGPPTAPLVLMIRCRGSNSWAFPKGHPDEVLDLLMIRFQNTLIGACAQGESDIDAAMRETVEESGVQVSQICEEVFCDVGYSFIKRLHADRWSKHPAYPDEARRPILVTAPQLQRFLLHISISR